MSDQEYLDNLLNAAVNGPGRTRPILIREREIEAYITTKGIREGSNSIPDDVIYRIYREWSPDPMKLTYFKRLFNRHFQILKRNGVRYYKLEADSFELPDFYSVFNDPNYFKWDRTERHTNYLGVYRFTKYKWTSKILLPTGKYLPLGTYKTAFEAAHTYDEAALQVYGKDAVLNFPKKWSTLINETKDVPLIYRKRANQRWYTTSLRQAKTEEKRYKELLEAFRRKTENST